MNYSKSFYQGLLFLTIAQSIVGFNIVCSKQLVTVIPVLLLIAIRFLLASFILLPLHWTTKAGKEGFLIHFKLLTRKDWLFLIAQALCAGIIFNIFMLVGLQHTDANTAGIITSTLPAIIAILSSIILKISINKKQGLCIVFASIGLAFIALSKIKHLHPNHSVIGDLLVLISLFPEAGYYVLTRLHAVKLPVFIFSSFMNAVNAVILLPWLCMHATMIHIDMHQTSILLFLGISTGIFYVFLFLGTQWVDSVTTALTTAIMPVATVILAWVWLGEQLSFLEFCGMVMVLLSIAVYAVKI